jgi:hypothetical protein
MGVDWGGLRMRLAQATGADADLDKAIAAAFQQPPGDYTASVEKCRTLVAAALPGWTLHLGFGASGVFPYASLAGNGTRVVVDAGTVPLAVLRAAVAVKVPESAKVSP